MGACHSTQTSSLNFRQKWIEQHFQKFPKQRTTSRGIPKFSKNCFSRKVSFHSLCSRNFRLNGSHSISGISGNFSRQFLYHLPVSKFSKVLVEWKAPNSSKVLPFVGKPENILPGWTFPFASLPESPVACEFSRLSLLLGAKDVRRNVCDSAKGISYWRRKICPEFGLKLWLVDVVVRDWSKSIGGGVGRSREGVGHEVLGLVQGVGRTIFSYP